MLQARELLLSQFLLAEGPRAVDEKSYDAASYLASEGALRHVSGFRFMIASPLLRLVLMAKLGTIGGDHLAKPTKPLPYNSNGLDVAAIITEAVDHFDKRSIVHAFRSSYKKNKATGNVAYLSQGKVYILMKKASSLFFFFFFLDHQDILVTNQSPMRQYITLNSIVF